MEPQQQPGQLGHNPYDFILNPPKPATQHPLGHLPLPMMSGKSLPLQLIVLIGGAVILMIIITVVVSILTGSKLNTTDLINLGAEQNEIVRVSSIGGGMVTQPSNQELAINTELTIETNHYALLNFLGSRGIKVSTKQQTADENLATTLGLKNAQQNSTVDTLFAKDIQTALQTYATNVKKDYSEASNTKLKALLRTDYAQAQLLLKEVPSSASLQHLASN